ncbi:MAG: electron transport complex subunit RsxC [Ruminococcaceae bacterium]|nr:electron transport complex subunit RsxC [Oscillospiraceae bacterium]
MKRGTFKHGIHPHEDGKAFSKDAAIQCIYPQGEAVYPMAQHIGAPAQPVVAVGDTVLVGQMIAQPGGFVSTAICSGVSGTVKAIEQRNTVSGRPMLSVVIDNDGQYTPLPTLGQPREAEGLTNQEILDIIRDAGVVGQGGAGFPTHVKLTMKPGVAPDTIIVNGAECEPYLTSDYRLMLEQPQMIIDGLKVVLQLFPEAQGVIGIEDNKPEAIRLIGDMVKDEPRIRIQRLKTKYPQGGERMLIKAITGREIYSGCLPIDAGCVVMNVSTICAIYAAVCQQTPLIATVMTITGDAVAKVANLRVPIGVSFREVLDMTGGLKCEAEKIISGGPLMGVAMTDLDVPVIKTSASILAMVRDEVAMWEPTACIRCGRCVVACPEKLVPPMMAHAADGGDLKEYERLNGMECMECGCCTYVCPAKRRLTQSFKFARASVMAERRKNAAKKEG